MTTVTRVPRAKRVVAVGGGKGGVGKSIVSANLAIALAAQGARVVLIDVDLGAPNLHTLLGLARPEGGLQPFLDGDVAALGDCAIRTSAYGVSLIAGTAQVGAANLSHKQKARVLDGVAGLDADVVLLDLGAGTTLNTLDFADLADLHVIVMTPQLTSLQNAYTFLKALLHRSIHLCVEDGADREVLAAAVAQIGETQRMDQLVARLRAGTPMLARRVATLLASYGVLIVGNQVRDDKDLQVIGNMSRMIRDFLLVPAPVTAVLRDSAAVRDSVNARRPLLLDGGGAVATELRRLAQQITAIDVARLRQERRAAGPRPLAAPGLPPVVRAS